MYEVSVQKALRALLENECPDELLEPIRRWAAEPVVSGRHLRRWLESGGQPQEEHPMTPDEIREELGYTAPEEARQ
jgi:hypothetical protein